MNTKEKMIGEFQCPGCVCGSSPKDECFKPHEVDPRYPFFRCNKHISGTNMMGVGSLYLGMPKGFNRVGMRSEAAYRHTQEDEGAHTNIRIWAKGTNPGWDNCNVAVWAMEKDGFLFVRTYMPRTNRSEIDIIEGGTMKLVPKAINVAEFIDEID